MYTTSRAYIGVATVFLLVQAATLYIMAQPLLSQSGKIMLWVGDIASSELSQQITDWYTFSHIIHGFVFYYALRWLFPQLSLLQTLIIALAIEVGWELIENSLPVIEHYRQQALAAGYFGDSILNSLSDTVAMILGFFIAYVARPVYVLVVIILFELGTLWCIRDNLTLNIINLIYPVPMIHEWQSEVIK